jgi:rsbT antagonist protein RsbS
MSVPLIEHDRFLLVPIQSGLTDTQLSELHAALLRWLAEQHPRGVMIDVALLDVLDVYAVRMLSDIGHWARLWGAPTVIVGIRSELAQAMDRFGLAFKEVATAPNWAEGLKMLAGSQCT